MQKQRIKAKVKDLVLNEGQLDWLPKNPRQWTRTDIELTKASLLRDPDFQEDNPLKLVALPDGKLLAFCGNLRTISSKELKWDTFESILYIPETEEDRETIKRRAILDNGSFGAWDYDALANEWDDLPLGDWGVPAWNNPAEDSEVNIDELFTDNHEASPSGDKIVIIIPANLSESTEEIKESIRELFEAQNLAGIIIK